MFILKQLILPIVHDLFRKLVMADFMETTDAKERIQNDKAFGIYDKNHDGFVTKDEVLKISGGSLTKEQVGKVCN